MSEAIKLVIRAACFAADKHRAQLRKGEDTTPYINHPLEVARILAEEGGVDDPEVIAAALLHDTIEDTETTARELESLFGERVSSLVLEVTDNKSLAKEERKRMQIEKAQQKSAGAALIKLADKTSNVRDVGLRPAVGWSDARRIGYVNWAQQVVNALPLKEHRLLEVFKTASSEAMASVNKNNSAFTCNVGFILSKGD